MSSITVTASQLKSSADQLESLNQQFKAAVESLEGQEQSVCGMWEGEAKQTFHNAFTRDKGNMQMFYNNIQKFIATLRNAAIKYEQAEAQSTQIASQRSY